MVDVRCRSIDVDLDPVHRSVELVAARAVVLGYFREEWLRAPDALAPRAVERGRTDCTDLSRTKVLIDPRQFAGSGKSAFIPLKGAGLHGSTRSTMLRAPFTAI